MIRRLMLFGSILILLSFTTFAQAQTYWHVTSIKCGLSSEMMTDFKIDYHYLFCRHIGLGGGIFLNSEFGQVTMPHGDISSAGHSISWNSETKVTNPGFSLSAIGQIDLFKVKERLVTLEFEPSWLLTIPRESQILNCQDIHSGELSSARVKASGGQWSAWLLRVGMSYCIGEHFAIGFSYNITNLDSFSTARRLEYGGTVFNKFYPDNKPVVHSADLGLRVFF